MIGDVVELHDRRLEPLPGPLPVPPAPRVNPLAVALAETVQAHPVVVILAWVFGIGALSEWSAHRRHRRQLDRLDVLLDCLDVLNSHAA